MEYRKTTTPSYVNFYLIAANVIYFLFVEWKGSMAVVEWLFVWAAVLIFLLAGNHSVTSIIVTEWLLVKTW